METIWEEYSELKEEWGQRELLDVPDHSMQTDADWQVRWGKMWKTNKQKFCTHPLDPMYILDHIKLYFSLMGINLLHRLDHEGLHTEEVGK